VAALPSKHHDITANLIDDRSEPALLPSLNFKSKAHSDSTYNDHIHGSSHDENAISPNHFGHDGLQWHKPNVSDFVKVDDAHSSHDQTTFSSDSPVLRQQQDSHPYPHDLNERKRDFLDNTMTRLGVKKKTADEVELEACPDLVNWNSTLSRHAILTTGALISSFSNSSTLRRFVSTLQPVHIKNYEFFMTKNVSKCHIGCPHCYLIFILTIRLPNFLNPITLGCL
jgi:hypothetical protein